MRCKYISRQRAQVRRGVRQGLSSAQHLFLLFCFATTITRNGGVKIAPRIGEPKKTTPPKLTFIIFITFMIFMMRLIFWRVGSNP